MHIDDRPTLNQNQNEEQRSRAEATDYFRRFAAARRLLIREGVAFPTPEAIRARAEKLSAEEVEAVLAERREEAARSREEERKARTAEAMRHEGRRR